MTCFGDPFELKWVQKVLNFSQLWVRFNFTVKHSVHLKVNDSEAQFKMYPVTARVTKPAAFFESGLCNLKVASVI